MKRSGVAGVGNWIVDLIHSIAHWPNEGDLVRISQQVTAVGGGAANVLTDLRLLEAPFPLAAFGCIGDDLNGKIVLDHCARIGLNTDGLTTLSTVATAYTHVMSVPGKSRTFFYHAGANDALLPEHIPIAELGAAGYRMFYIGYLMALAGFDRLASNGTTGAARILQAARSAGMITCVDLVSDSRPDFASIVTPALAHCDYLIVNEVEASRAAGVTIRTQDGDLERPAAEDAAQRLLELGVVEAVVIHAPEGVLWRARGGATVWCPAERVPAESIVSSVGAGDAFCAAVLYGLHEGWPVELMLGVAHRVAVACLGGATATSGIGPMSSFLTSRTSAASRV